VEEEATQMILGAEWHGALKVIALSAFRGNVPISTNRTRERFRPFEGLRRGTVTAICLALWSVGFVASALPAAAQSTGRTPTIEVAAEIKVAPAVMTPVRIRISGGGMVKQAMVMVRGVPPRVTFSEGRSFTPGVWIVPLANIAKLEIAPATGTSGKSNLTFELIALDGKILADAQSTLSIIPASAASSEAAQNDTLSLTAGPLPGNPQLTGALPGAAATSLTPDEIDRARKLMEKGDVSMESGKVTSARLFYQSAAEHGWAPAALALGATYDSSELSRAKVIGGVQPDPVLARKWYQKAKELGAPEAERRLQQMGAR
jgi:hypothetical protein